MGIKNLTEAEEKEFYRLVGKMNGKEPDKDVKVKKPEIGTRYYYLDSVGDIVNAVWDDTEYDNTRWDLGNVFLTEKEIVFAIEKRKVEVELERYAKEHNAPTLEASYFILYDEYNEELDYDMWADCRPQGAGVFASKQLVFDAIESIGRDRIIKYIFGGIESEGEE